MKKFLPAILMRSLYLTFLVLRTFARKFSKIDFFSENFTIER